MLTENLAKAVDKAAQLPPDAQDALAARILLELESEARWEVLFAESQDMLDEWAAEARAEHRAGKTIPVDRQDR